MSVALDTIIDKVSVSDITQTLVDLSITINAQTEFLTLIPEKAGIRWDDAVAIFSDASMLTPICIQRGPDSFSDLNFISPSGTTQDMGVIQGRTPTIPGGAFGEGVAVVSGSKKTYFSSDVNAAANTQTEIFGAQGANTQIWVYGYEFHANAAGTMKLESANTAKTGVMPVGANGGSARDVGDADGPIFKCATNEDLNITTVTCEIDGVVNGFVVDVS